MRFVAKFAIDLLIIVICCVPVVVFVEWSFWMLAHAKPR